MPLVKGSGGCFNFQFVLGDVTQSQGVLRARRSDTQRRTNHQGGDGGGSISGGGGRRAAAEDRRRKGQAPRWSPAHWVWQHRTFHRKTPIYTCGAFGLGTRDLRLCFSISIPLFSSAEGRAHLSGRLHFLYALDYTHVPKYWNA
jgi:hypothetical protein